MSEALNERMQNAREAGMDEIGDGQTHSVLRADAVRAIEAAIETATRVQFTPEVYDAAYRAYDREAAILEALKALGFEVES